MPKTNVKRGTIRPDGDYYNSMQAIAYGKAGICVYVEGGCVYESDANNEECLGAATITNINKAIADAKRIEKQWALDR